MWPGDDFIFIFLVGVFDGLCVRHAQQAFTNLLRV